VVTSISGTMYRSLDRIGEFLIWLAFVNYEHELKNFAIPKYIHK
jgi:hypothetical protein